MIRRQPRSTLFPYTPLSRSDIKGNTRRSYGRVYYVQKKLLIFYAFDLQDKKHNRAAAGFQAWGYRQPSDGQPVVLLILEIEGDRKSTRLNSSHQIISYAVFC